MFLLQLISFAFLLCPQKAQVISRRALSNELAKQWFVYVEMFIKSRTSIVKNQGIIVSNYLKWCMRNSKLFGKLATKVRNVIHDPTSTGFQTKPLINLWKPQERFRMNKWILFEDVFDPKNIHLTVHFDLTKALRLNITLHYLYFSANSISKCQYASLNISSVARNRAPMPHHLFCGIHSETNIFPLSRMVSIVMRINSFDMAFDSWFTCSVVDNLLLVSQPKVGRESGLIEPLFALDLIQLNRTLITYAIQVHKAGQLQVKLELVQKSFIEAYDGPGRKYRIVSPMKQEPNHMVYDMSSFQCVVDLYLLKDSFHHHVNYTSRKKFMHHTIRLKSNMAMVFPDRKANYDPVIWVTKITTETGAKINLTVSSLMYTGSNQSSCNFAGLAAYHALSGQELMCVCETQRGFYQIRPIYSGSSEMFVVMYSYKKYGVFNVTVRLSETKCHTRKINICQFVLKNKIFEGTDRQKLGFQESCVVLQLFYHDEHSSLLHKYPSQKNLWYKYGTQELRYLVPLRFRVTNVLSKSFLSCPSCASDVHKAKNFYLVEAITLL